MRLSVYIGLILAGACLYALPAHADQLQHILYTNADSMQHELSANWFDNLPDWAKNTINWVSNELTQLGRWIIQQVRGH